MERAQTERMVAWKLKATMDAHGVTRYALQKRTHIAMNTLRGMYDGETLRPDLRLLDRIIHALGEMTGQPMTLTDVLEFTPSRDA